MNDWRTRYSSKKTSLAGAIRRIPRGKHIFIGSGAAEPNALVRELVEQKDRFADNTIVHLMTLGPAPYVQPGLKDCFRHNAFFIGANVREAVREGRADYTPVFLSQIPDLIRARRTPVDVALIQVSPPDAFGFVNLGVSVDVVLAAVESARLVIAQVNPRMPVVHGAGFVPMDQIDVWVEHEAPLPELTPSPPDEVALEIGRYVAQLVTDGATLQVGIGQIPDAVLASLRDRRDLGIWTEMMSDGVVDLIENGNISGRYKTVEPHKVTSTFTMGTQRTYDFVDGNPLFSFQPSDYVNNPVNVARQHRMVAVNSALQVDLTGQVCSDSIGERFYSGIGGQVDFIRGASMCPGGKPIIAIRSTAKQGTVSRIAAALDAGAGVVTSRGDVRYVVTEYGIADLQGRSVRERAMELITIAHPDFRAELLAAAKERRFVFGDQLEPRQTYAREHERIFETTEGAKVLFRPIREKDERRMQDLFYSFSDETVYQRWMGAQPRMPRSRLQRYLKVDDTQNVAIVVQTLDERVEPELLGVARYHADDTGFADVAFVVRDDWQGKGLGTALFRHLIEIAQQNGIRGFTADVLATNTHMMRVFHSGGLDVSGQLEGNVYHLSMPFENGN
jgi:acyl-CoA hydrolase/GNAT superfamily N-acetyltransferase